MNEFVQLLNTMIFLSPRLVQSRLNSTVIYIDSLLWDQSFNAHYTIVVIIIFEESVAEDGLKLVLSDYSFIFFITFHFYDFRYDPFTYYSVKL